MACRFYSNSLSFIVIQLCFGSLLTTHCSIDTDCDDIYTYCQTNECKVQRRHHQDCNRNGQCASNVCRDGSCGLCNASSNDCTSNKYCGDGGMCYEKVNAGESCKHGNDMCKSNRCDRGKGCIKCTDSSCARIQYCAPNDDCTAKKYYGEKCAADVECKSMKCNNPNGDHLGQCGCTDNTQCDSSSYCNKIMNKCANQLIYSEACYHDEQCQSNKCIDPGECACDKDNDCQTNEYCDTLSGHCYAASSSSVPTSASSSTMDRNTSLFARPEMSSLGMEDLLVKNESKSQEGAVNNFFLLIILHLNSLL